MLLLILMIFAVSSAVVFGALATLVHGHGQGLVGGLIITVSATAMVVSLMVLSVLY